MQLLSTPLHLTLGQFPWPVLTALSGIVVSVIASAHAILYKRDSRSAVAWVGVIWLVPFVGAILYVLLGINRVRRRASGYRRHRNALSRQAGAVKRAATDFDLALGDRHHHLAEMARVASTLTGSPLLAGNRVEPLINGDRAYPAMIDAIDRAERSISLCVYIFDDDAVGRRFIDALAAAAARGVEVRVLIDAVGARYSMPPTTKTLRRRGIRTELFMSSIVIWRTPYFNLRNHRKILVVDGATGFTGGMNIRECHLVAGDPVHATHDTHFRLTGPIVGQLQDVFAGDWAFTTDERLDGERWFPEPAADAGPIHARVIPDGPDRDLDKMSMAFQGALAVARHSVKIVTPYFLPDRALIAALNTCALRGVEVDIVLPQRNNLKLVAWASMAQMWQVLEWGCRVWMTQPQFDHSKLMVIDDALSLIGSSNWDPRSLRLNFELGVECYGVELAASLSTQIAKRLIGARPLTLEEVNARPLHTKLRDGVVRLAAPYL